MARRYVEGDGVRFTRSGLSTVDMELYGGEKECGLTPKRLFPVTGEDRYISLLDEEGKESAIIRNINNLMPDSRQAVEEALGEYYFIPEITRIVEVKDSFGQLKFEVETDKGRVKFEVKNRHYDIKKVYGDRVLIRDKNDNRYEIPDYTKLDTKSIKQLYQYI